MENLFRYFAYAGFILGLSLSIRQILIRNKDKRNYALSLFFFALSIIEFASFNTLPNLTYLLPVLSFADMPFIFCIGPCLFIIFKETNFPSKKNKPYTRHFFLPLIATGFALPYYLLDSAEKTNRMKNVFIHNKLYAHEAVYFAGVIVASIYIIYLLSRVPILFTKESRANEIGAKFILGLLIISTVVVITALAGMITHHFILFRISSTLIFIFILVIMLIGYRAPNYYHNLIKLMHQSRDAHSQLQNLDVAQLLEKLKHVMQQEKVFLDEDLSLLKLAHSLQINQHQCSELLNKYENKNFSQYINEFRIQEAKNLMCESELSITDIAYRCGFHSLSAFQRAFQKAKGCSASEYRKNLKF